MEFDVFSSLSPFENRNSYEKKKKKKLKNGAPKELYSNLLVDTGLNISSIKNSSNTGLAIALAKNEVKNI